MQLNRPALFTASSLALAVGLLTAGSPLYAQAPASAPENCANIKNEAAKQSCSNAAEQVDPLANQGEATPTQGGVASAEASGGAKGEIVVTGSRLRRDERTSADPLTVIDPNVQNREGRLDTAEILQSSPLAAGSTQITSALSTNFVVNGGEGVQTISLRGLGANRTLVLLNGRRAGPAGVRGGVSAFDLNVIPQDVIQSVEILKTGASSIYGSDAIAGVVNLITKKDLRGLNVRGFASVPTRSGGEQYNISASYGLGLGDRGHASISVGYNKFAELERGDRSFLGCEEENVSNIAGQRVDPIDPRTGQAYCGAFLNNAIILTSAGANNLFGPCVTALPGVLPARGCAAGTVRRAIGAIQFDPTLAQYLSTTDQVGPFFAGRAGAPLNAQSFRSPTGFFPVGAFTAQGLALENNYDARVNGDSVIPKTTRFTVYGEGGYDLTDDVNLYFEGLYNRRKTKTDASRQLFFDQYPACFVNTNPCPAALRGDPLNTGFTGYAYLTPVIYAPFNSSTDVKYFRGLGGAHANLDKVLPHGFADFYFQHSRSNGDYNRDIIFRDAIEFGVAENRTALCAGTVTAIRGVPCIDINYTDPRVLRGDFTDQERAFLFGVDRGKTKYRQNTAELSAGGDLFNLPGGAIKFALGAQYRRDSINDTPGEASLTDNLFASTSSGITAGHQTTKEVFGETEFPLLKDIPFVRELTLNAAGRYTSTKSVRSFDGASDTDHAFTYKIAANWRPVSPLRLRATYGTSFRSPALFEQFLADESGFAAGSSDPCSNLAVQENQTIIQNCVSQGLPAPGGTTPVFISRSSIESFSGGGIGVLNPEKSKALTLSAILTPDGWFWRGGQFSFAVDYIDIEVKNQVTQLGATNILRGCYTSATFPTDPLCSLFTRAPAGSANAFQITSVRDPYINIDTERNKSIDFTARYRQDLGSLGTLSLLGQATYQVKDKFKLFANTPLNTNGEAGDPKWVGDLNVTWTKAPWTVTYGLQVISGTNDIRNLRTVGGSALNSDNCINSAAAVALRGGPYCPIYKLPRVAYHSLSVELQATKDISFLVGMANIFNKKPPLVSTVGAPISAFGQVPTNGSYYDYLGRRLFVTARARLGGL